MIMVVMCIWFEIFQNNLHFMDWTGKILDDIIYLQGLKVLNLNYISLGGHFPASLFNLSSLQVIFLSDTYLGGSLPLDLCTNSFRNLTHLDLSINVLTGKVPLSLSQCSQLEMLDISYNQFIGGELSVDIGNLTKLQILNFAQNNITGT